MSDFRCGLDTFFCVAFLCCCVGRFLGKLQKSVSGLVSFSISFRIQLRVGSVDSWGAQGNKGSGFVSLGVAFAYAE